MKWQLTATTIYCDAVDDEVTLIVHEDGSAKCTGYKKYGKSGQKAANPAESKSEQPGCEGLECHRLIQYKDKLFAEEVNKGDPKQTDRETAVPN